MMTINLNIKANVNNISLSEIYELLQKYSIEKVKDKKVYDFKGYKFQIETDINMSINYVVTELPSELLPKRLSASAYTQAMSGNYEEFVKWWDSKS